MNLYPLRSRWHARGGRGFCLLPDNSSGHNWLLLPVGSGCGGRQGTPPRRRRQANSVPKRRRRPTPMHRAQRSIPVRADHVQPQEDSDTTGPGFRTVQRIRGSQMLSVPLLAVDAGPTGKVRVQVHPRFRFPSRSVCRRCQRSVHESRRTVSRNQSSSHPRQNLPKEEGRRENPPLPSSLASWSGDLRTNPALFRLVAYYRNCD